MAKQSLESMQILEKLMKSDAYSVITLRQHRVQTRAEESDARTTVERVEQREEGCDSFFTEWTRGEEPGIDTTGIDSTLRELLLGWYHSYGPS
eukprot:2095323-Rhodomonas_salina.1